jgi:hypothetical protein
VWVIPVYETIGKIFYSIGRVTLSENAELLWDSSVCFLMNI